VGTLLRGRVVETTRRHRILMPNARTLAAEITPHSDAPPASLGTPAFGPIRPDRMTVRPTDDGRFGIDVRWTGRECILRSVVVRRLLTDAGYTTASGNSADGRIWELQVTGIPADEVASLIRDQIW
jgi:hypothetical protein